MDEDSEAASAERIAELAGPDAERLFELLSLLDEHLPSGTYAVLQLLGVEPQWRQQGIGCSDEPDAGRCDLERHPAYLEATSESSLPLYERHGFTVFGQIQLPDGPPLFQMWRSPA